MANSSVAQEITTPAPGFLLDPQLSSSGTTTNKFSGAYIGISDGVSNDNLLTYISHRASPSIFGGVFAGYNHEVYPWLNAGFELQFDVTKSWYTDAIDYDVTALARLGMLTSDNFSVYQMAGFGFVRNRGVYAVGFGIEQKFSDSFSLRGNIVSYGHATPQGTNAMVGGISIMKIEMGAVWKINDLSAPDIDFSYLTVSGPVTDFTGPYLGVYTGLLFNPDYNFFGLDYLIQLHLTRMAHGVIAGWNYALTDMLRAGVEVQGGFNYNTSSGYGADAQLLARLGAIPMPGLFLYGTAGVGMLENRAAYVAGGGIEYALWGENTVRLDVQLQGEMVPAPPANLAGFTAAKFSLGTIWHLN